MNRMACSVTDGIQYDDSLVDLPSGMDLYEHLPNDFADELIADEMLEMHQPSNRTNCAQIFALEAQTRGDDAEFGRLARILIRDIKTQIGNSDFAARYFINGFDDY